MKKSSIIALFVLSAAAAFFCGKDEGYQAGFVRGMTQDANGALHSRLIMYEMLSKGEVEDAKSSLEKTINNQYRGLNRYQALDVRLESGEFGDILRDIAKKSQDIQPLSSNALYNQDAQSASQSQ